MSKEEIRSKIAELKLQLDSTVNAIQTERQEAKEDETTVIEELIINQGIIEENIADLESLLFTTHTIPEKNYILSHKGVKRKVRVVQDQLVDSSKGMISESSPLAKALTKAEIGELIKISTPIGESEFQLLGIE